MPELPDVEGFRRVFRRHARNMKVLKLRGEDEIIRNSTGRGLGRALKGKRFSDPYRHGKWLICPADGKALMLHFGMTGDLLWAKGGEENHPHDRLVLEVDGGELRYRNVRKLGGVWVADDSDVSTVTGEIGPDAYDVSKKDFLERLRRRRGSVKSALMDQKLVAGLGNLTVDETLWRARISPRARVGSLSEDAAERLYGRMRRVLKDSMKEGRVPDKRSWLTGRRDWDGKCPRCRRGLKSARIAGRTSYWCPRCQPR